MRTSGHDSTSNSRRSIDLAQLAGLSQQPITPVAANSGRVPAAEKQGDDPKNPSQPYQIGSDLSVQPSLHDGLFLWLNTPNKDFTMHLGAWAQFDSVWWNQSPALRAAPGARPGSGQGVATGVDTGGIGQLEEVYSSAVSAPMPRVPFGTPASIGYILALENDQFSTSGLDEFWGRRNEPSGGRDRPDRTREDPHGPGRRHDRIEPLHDLHRRSSYSEAIELNQNFVTGVWLNNYLDQRMTWEFAAFYPDQKASSGVFFGDGQSGIQGRLTGLPIYEDEGRHLLHLGISAWLPERPMEPTNRATPWSYRHVPKCATTTPLAAAPVSFPMPTASEWSTRGLSPPITNI